MPQRLGGEDQFEIRRRGGGGGGGGQRGARRRRRVEDQFKIRRRRTEKRNEIGVMHAGCWLGRKSFYFVIQDKTGHVQIVIDYASVVI